jgi:mono/diheme cytochrome c family protein
MHQQMGQKSMARTNRRLSEEFNNLQKMIPGLDKPADESYDEKEISNSLHKASLYSQNCASCHGDYGQGMAGVFPPLINSRLVTGDKTIPIRILLNGLQGKVTVQGKTYQGIMPSFKARLSTEEIAAILTYLRERSD